MLTACVSYTTHTTDELTEEESQALETHFTILSVSIEAVKYRDECGIWPYKISTLASSSDLADCFEIPAERIDQVFQLSNEDERLKFQVTSNEESITMWTAVKGDAPDHCYWIGSDGYTLRLNY